MWVFRNFETVAWLTSRERTCPNISDRTPRHANYKIKKKKDEIRKGTLQKYGPEHTKNKNKITANQTQNFHFFTHSTVRLRASVSSFRLSNERTGKERSPPAVPTFFSFPSPDDFPTRLPVPAAARSQAGALYTVYLAEDLGGGPA
jgi:hypothetical protein